MLKHRNIAIGAILVTLLVGGGVWVYLSDRENSTATKSNPQTETITTAKSEANKDTASEQPTDSLQEGESSSLDQSNNQTDSDDDQNNLKNVDIVLTRVSVDESLVTAAGYIDANVSGKCKLRIVSNNKTKTYTEDSQTDPANPENTNCSNFRIPRSEIDNFSSWTAQLSFESESYTGQSLKWSCQNDSCQPS